MTVEVLEFVDRYFGPLLRRTRQAWFRARLLETVLTTTALLTAAVLVGFAADNLVNLPGAVRGGYFMVVGLLALRLWVRRFKQRLFLTPLAAALEMERSNQDLECRLVNTLLLARDPSASASPFMAPLLRETRRAIEMAPLKKAVSFQSLRKPAAITALALLGILAYAFYLPERFGNAAARFADPFGGVPPLTGTRLAISPGDVALVAGASLLIEGAPYGEIPPAAALLLESEGGRERLHMVYAGGTFHYHFDRVLKDFSYRITAGDFASPAYRVKVVHPPRPRLLRITRTFPEYTGLPPVTEETLTGNLTALMGTRLTFEIAPDRRAPSGRIRTSNGQEKPLRSMTNGWLTADLKVMEDLSYTVDLFGPEGETDPEPPSYRITASRDGPPSVRFVRPGKDRVVQPGTVLSFLLEARDDIGLKRVELVPLLPTGERTGLGEGLGGDSVEEGLNGSFEPGVTLSRPVRELAMETALDGGSRVLLFKARALDRAGQEGESGPLRVLIQGDTLSAKQACRLLTSSLADLHAVLALQVKALESAKALSAGLPGIRDPVYLKGMERIAGFQEAVRYGTEKVLRTWMDPGIGSAHDFAPDGRNRLSELLSGPMTRCASSARNGGKADHDHRKGALAGVMELQAGIVRELRAILREGEALLETFLEGLTPSESPPPPDDREGRPSPGEVAEETVRTLKAFAEMQRKAVEAAADLVDEQPEDFTPLEKALLEALEQTENEWGQAIRSLHDDYYKLQQQDFSDSTLSEELVEIFSEVELAEQALEQQAVEIAVPHMGTGLELAEAITANLERWLADKPDRIKWAMEDPLEDYEVPMAELPEELEDIVGDLLDEETAMSDEIEDLTSGWTASLNEGAGWTAQGGPISNMTARGVTGNLLPNQQEVGGRSGEGRSGRSHGQMVESTAQGKGGRQTPTRVTPDPYEAGEVKDSSRDPEGGATGGGKLSGSAPEGLRGPPGPEGQNRMERLASRQSEIRQNGERLKQVFDLKGYHPEDLERALRIMTAMEEALRSHAMVNYVEAHRAVIGRLERLQSAAGVSLQLDREGLSRLPDRLRRAVRSALDEPMPKEFEELISRYYRSLTETEEE